MQISTQSDTFCRKYGDIKAIQLLAEAGWDAIDYSIFDYKSNSSVLVREDYREYVNLMLDTAKAHGISFNQAHAPFPSYKHGDSEYNTSMFGFLVRSIEIAGMLGAEAIVVHPITQGDTYEKQKSINIEFYNSLLPYCKEYGIKIALENMFGYENGHVTPAACSAPKEFIDYLDSLDSEYFCACLDIGHAEIEGSGSVSAASMILELGAERLTALHVHDNDKRSDLHNLPFTRSINWGEIVDALIKIGYSGVFTFEADGFLNKFPSALYLDASKFMAQVARHLSRDLKQK